MILRRVTQLFGPMAVKVKFRKYNININIRKYNINIKKYNIRKYNINIFNIIFSYIQQLVSRPTCFTNVPQHPRKAQSGSALIMGVLTMWLIIYAISMVGHVTQAIGSKMKAQMAADTAALAGARIMANNLSTIAWINDSRAILYYCKVRYGADLVAAGTLALLKVKPALMSNGSYGPAISDQALWGQSNFTKAFADLYQNTTEDRIAPWSVNNSEFWSANSGPIRQVKGQNADEALARFQHSLGMITRVMVEKEVYDKAHDNGSYLTAFFPTFKMYPEPGDERYLNISAIDSDTDSSGNTVAVNGWRLQNDDLDIKVTNIGTESWHISATIGDRQFEARIEKNKPQEGWIYAEYTENQGGSVVADNHVYIDTVHGLIITDDMRIQIENLPDGSTRITKTQNGQTNTFRYRYENGRLLVYNNTTGEFEDPNPAGSGPDSVNVNGTQVRVENFTSINFGSATLWTDRIRMGPFTVYYENPVRIISDLYGFHIYSENNAMHVNGLSTQNADGLWHNVWNQRDNGYQDDNTRHRMTVIESQKEWKYEFVREPSYLKEEQAQDDPTQPDRFYEHGRNMVSQENANIASGDLKTASNTLLDYRTGTLARNDNGQVLHHQQRTCWHPEDLHCAAKHANPTDIDWCTPNANQPNGKFHDAISGAQRVCPLCGGAGLVRVSAETLTSATAIQDLINAADPNNAEVQQILGMLKQYPNIIESLKRRPNTSTELPPLVLREDYFKYGISVGTWIGGSNIQGTQGSSNLNLPAENDAFKQSDRGYYAFASARAGFRDPATGKMVYGFAEGALSAQAFLWVNSEQNLYLADWEASLVPMKTQIHTDDLEANETDSGLTYLLRRLSSTVWRETFFSRNQSNNIRIQNFDLNSLELYDLLQH